MTAGLSHWPNPACLISTPQHVLPSFRAFLELQAPQGSREPRSHPREDKTRTASKGSRGAPGRGAEHQEASRRGPGDRLGPYGSARGGPAVAWGAAPPAAGEGRAAVGGGWRRRAGGGLPPPRRAGSGPRRDCSTARPGGSGPSGPARPSLSFLSASLRCRPLLRRHGGPARQPRAGHPPPAPLSPAAAVPGTGMGVRGGAAVVQLEPGASRPPSGCGLRPPEGLWGGGGWAARCHRRVRGCGRPGCPAGSAPESKLSRAGWACAPLLEKAAAVRMLAAAMRPVMQCRVRVSSRAVTCPRGALRVSPVPGAVCCECLLRKVVAPCEACYWSACQ